MLIIRPEQLEPFQQVAEAAFAMELVEELREESSGVMIQLPNGSFTIDQIPEEVLYEMVRNGITRAHKYGLSWEYSIGGFVTLMFEAAPNFDEHPLIQRVLKDEDTAPDSRIDELIDRTTDENWEAVEQNYDANAWGIASQG